MATKKDALDILKLDLRKKLEEIDLHYADVQKPLEKKAKMVRQRVRKTVEDAVIKTIRKMPQATVKEPDRLTGQYCPPIEIRYHMDPEYRAVQKLREKAQNDHKKDRDKLLKKASKIERHIKLHGVDAEILDALNSL